SDMLYKLTRVVRPSEIILAADGTQQLNYPVTQPQYARAGERFADSVSPLSPGNLANAYYNPANPVMDLPIFGSSEPNFENVGGTTNGLVRWRHGADTAANSGFIDGHAETRKMGLILNRNMRPD
ncbi:MAG: hypothetical protein HC898_03130, partial [Phycisphaerales bacterium]|nr:hypothetical protein [Phycisphaerales bacterium]